MSKEDKIVGKVQKYRQGEADLYEKPPKKVPNNKINAAVQEWMMYGPDHLPEIVARYGFTDEKHAYTSIVRRLGGAVGEQEIKATRNEMGMKLRGFLNVLMPNAVTPKRQMKDEKGTPIRDYEGNLVVEDNPMHLPSLREARAVIHDIAVLEGLNAPQVHAVITPDAEEFDTILRAMLSSQGHQVETDAYDLLFEEGEDGIYTEVSDDKD